MMSVPVSQSALSTPYRMGRDRGNSVDQSAVSPLPRQSRNLNASRLSSVPRVPAFSQGSNASNGELDQNYHTNSMAGSLNDLLASQATQQATQPPMAEEPESASSPPRPAQPEIWGRLTAIDELAKMEPHPRVLSGSSAFRIGRGSASHLHINHLTISSRHCSIVFEEATNAACILDHNSSNGTYVNAERLDPETKYYLAHGDHISFVAPSKVFAEAFAKAQVSSNEQNSAKKQRMSVARPTGFTIVYQMLPAPSHFPEEVIKRTPRIFTSQFAILQELGKGNFATVYRAISRRTGEHVAVKVIERARFLNMSQARWQAQVKEAEVLEKLDHPGIVSFRKLIQTDDALYVVTELLQGGELFDRLVNHGPYTEQSARVVMRRILEAVAYLHDRNIVHRDLKPENIVMKTAGDDLDVKLVDFGVATELKGGGRKTFCGSMTYVAPEVLKRRNSALKQGTYGKAVDMWSVGVIVHVILTCKPPFDEEDDGTMHETLQHVLRFESADWTHISRAAKDFIRRCFELKEERRMTAKQALMHEWLLY